MRRYKFEDDIQRKLRYGENVKSFIKKPRENWDQAFQIMHEKRDDKLLIDDDINLDDWK